jgi:carbon monoxide dehydrogenase subunit G
MQLENSFVINAPPDRVFAYLLVPQNVVGCVPGAELTEQVDAVTFKGKVKIKVGPITVAYSGTGRLVDRDDAQRIATLEGEGRETTGPGSGRGKAMMSVTPDGDGSLVKVVTEFTLTGRVAQFGRGVIEDVSKRMVREVAECLQANLQAAPPDSPPENPEGPAAETGEAPASSGEAAPPPSPPPVRKAREVNAVGLLFSVLGGYVIDPGFWEARIKVLDGMVSEVERLSDRFGAIVSSAAQPR